MDKGIIIESMMYDELTKRDTGQTTKDEQNLLFQSSYNQPSSGSSYVDVDVDAASTQRRGAHAEITGGG